MTSDIDTHSIRANGLLLDKVIVVAYFIRSRSVLALVYRSLSVYFVQIQPYLAILRCIVIRIFIAF